MAKRGSGEGKPWFNACMATCSIDSEPDMSTSQWPTRTDPAIVLVPDRVTFTCWVEHVGSADQWVFLSCDGERHLGPAARGRTTVPAVHALVCAWWESRKRLEGTGENGRLAKSLMSAE